KATSRLSEQVRTKQIEKEYLAIIKGTLDQKEGTFKDKIKKLENGNSVIAEDGKEAILNYQVLSEKEGLSLVRIELITGRHHQIRVQFSSRGYPLCGDQRYGEEDKTQIALFAYKLSFYHPTTKERLTFTLLPKGDWWTEFTLSKCVQ
ncbi:MAG: RNA pseudouridine synthase, partial [Romboutsia sp.]|nr:RNA pseudouridine synthase [Romboutsia sp.]